MSSRRNQTAGILWYTMFIMIDVGLEKISQRKGMNRHLILDFSHSLKAVGETEDLASSLWCLMQRWLRGREPSEDVMERLCARSIVSNGQRFSFCKIKTKLRQPAWRIP